MKLCNDCVCRNQCGNDNVTFCAGYTKEVPTKWVTNEEYLKSCTMEQLAEKLWEIYDAGKDDAKTYDSFEYFIDKEDVVEWLKEIHK